MYSNFKRNGYSIFHYNREERTGGGVAVIYRDWFKLNNGKIYNFKTFECILVTISSNTTQKISFLVVYRFCELPPADFLSEFYNFTENNFIHLNNLVILGDFNLHMNKVFDPHVIQFNQILSTFGFSQLIDEPTHVSGNTLDLLITNEGEIKINDIVIDEVNYSDHCFIFFKIPWEFKKPQDEIISIKNYKCINLDKFKNDIVSKVNDFTQKSHESFSHALNEYNTICVNTINEYVSTKSVNVNKSKPKWIDAEYIKSRAERRRLYKRWVRTRNEKDRFDYVTVREKNSYFVN